MPTRQYGGLDKRRIDQVYKPWDIVGGGGRSPFFPHWPVCADALIIFSRSSCSLLEFPVLLCIPLTQTTRRTNQCNLRKPSSESQVAKYDLSKKFALCWDDEQGVSIVQCLRAGAYFVPNHIFRLIIRWRASAYFTEWSSARSLGKVTHGHFNIAGGTVTQGSKHFDVPAAVSISRVFHGDNFSCSKEVHHAG